MRLEKELRQARLRGVPGRSLKSYFAFSAEMGVWGGVIGELGI